jgi:hypothetical protein
MDLDSVFSGVQNAKELSGFAPKLKNGTHTVVLTRFNVKESQKDRSKIAEADFQILESDTETVNAVRGWPWFIGGRGFAGEYAMSRLKDFIEAVQQCIGDTGAIKDTGALLAGPGQAGKGIVLKVSVYDGKKMKDGNGFYQELKWTPIPQTLEDIKVQRAKLESQAAVTAAAATTQSVAQTAQPAQTATGGASQLLASLGRK